MGILEISYRVIQMSSEHALDVEQKKNEELDMKYKENSLCACGRTIMRLTDQAKGICRVCNHKEFANHQDDDKVLDVNTERTTEYLWN